jgi:hypothetical protein
VEKQSETRYTQRQWERTVGWGTVPDEYVWPPKEDEQTAETDTQPEKK